jgi:hypothetical protein
MNKTQQKVKDWIISHFRHPEKIENIDHVWIDFLVVTLPSWVLQVGGYALTTFIYIWLYNKFGFEKVLILLLINIIFAIGFVRKALIM